MKIFRTANDFWVENEGHSYRVEGASWDALITRDDLYDHLHEHIGKTTPQAHSQFGNVLAPIESQEVWAAGVTYYRSRNARMEESKSAGGGDFYDRVYDAERPELFFKATPHRVAGPFSKVAIRDDASWSVPEPELTLLITPSG